MAREIILSGRVQGVFCRNYCSQYAKRFGLSGSASNLSNGTVSVILDTDDESLVRDYMDALMNNPAGVRFYGRIESITQRPYAGRVPIMSFEHGPVMGRARR
jgi:acylphosphatase